MFETLQNSLSVDATITALASAGVTPAVAIFGLLIALGALLFAANTVRKALSADHDWSARCDSVGDAVSLKKSEPALRSAA